MLSKMTFKLALTRQSSQISPQGGRPITRVPPRMRALIVQAGLLTSTQFQIESRPSPIRREDGIRFMRDIGG
jgi:hypothetical protein